MRAIMPYLAAPNKMPPFRHWPVRLSRADAAELFKTKALLDAL